MQKKSSNLKYLTICLVLVLFSVSGLIGQTTGKISGKVTDKETGNPLPGTNILLVGENLGAASDIAGDYYIINLNPGTYTIRAQMIGYDAVIINNVQVSVNRTAYLDIEMSQGVIQGQTVVVEANKISFKKDQTSTVKNISADDMQSLPVESIGDVVAMQAGIVNGHFRGGRSGEVSYMIDGMQVSDVFSGDGKAVDIETDAVQDLEIITGTFNAEYGRAMSGIVNAVTKTGSNKFKGGVSGSLGNYITGNDDIFIGLKTSEIARNQDYKFHISGPIIKDRLHFFMNYRFQDNKNHLNGIRRFNPDDFSMFESTEPSMWYSEHTGDSNYVSMNGTKNQSFMAKISPNLGAGLRLSFMYTLNKDEWNSYDHGWKYNPDGRPSAHRNSQMYAISLNHMVSQSLFYNLNYSFLNNDFGYYKYEDPLDSRYIHDAYSSNYGPGFFTGGEDKGHTKRLAQDHTVKFDLTWQANKNHSFKSGIQYFAHSIDQAYHSIMNRYERVGWNNEEMQTLPEDVIAMDPANIFEWNVRDDGSMFLDFKYYEPMIMDDSTLFADVYKVKPVEFGAYIQDKMEFESMVINFGIRYDYLDQNRQYPSDRRNPANQMSFYENDENGDVLTEIINGDTVDVLNMDKMSTMIDTKPVFQISPRLGFSYQLGSQAVIHFSYGHFFQMPRFEAMYQNNSMLIAPNNFSTVQGNPELKAQKTVQYEIGLWQQINDYMDIDVTLYYKDIYDLLSTKVLTTYNQIKYGLYTNKDYGNTRGLELKYNIYTGPLSMMVNYTLQYTRGIADNPTHSFDRAGNSMDPIPLLIPMSWDQRHTLNVSVSYNTKNYGGTLTGYFNSGSPYTWGPLEQSVLSRVNLYSNNAWKPTNNTLDLRTYYRVGPMTLTLKVYNLLDKLNEYGVYGSTGRAYTTIVQDTDLNSHHSDFNEYEDRIQNPSMYSTPRQVKFGIEYNF